MKHVNPRPAASARKTSSPGSTGSRFLDSLPTKDCARLVELSRLVDMPIRTPIYSRDNPLRYAYFLTAGLASVVYTSEHGSTIELATIGDEGIVGWLSLLGPSHDSSDCMMQIGGAGYRIPLKALQHEFEDSPEIRRRVNEFAQHQSLLAYQIVACNRLHQAAARFSRWMLMAQDRIGDDKLPMTQEFLANMLGTRRTTVAEVAGALQRAGAIEYRRGVVRIVSRPLLESHACECCGIIRNLFNDLYRTK